MVIKVGDKIPSVTLRYVTPDGVKAVTTAVFRVTFVLHRKPQRYERAL